LRHDIVAILELILLILATLGLLLAAIAEAACTAVFRRPLRELLELLAEPASLPATRLERLRQATDGVRVALLLMQGILALVLSDLLRRLLGTAALAVGIVSVAGAAIIAQGVVVAVGRSRQRVPIGAQRLALWTGQIARPLVALGALFARVVAGPPQPSPLSASGMSPDEEAAMVVRVLRLDRLTARDVMVPRMDIAAVPADMTARDVLALARQTGHARFPVYREHIDQIVGVVVVKDVLQLLENPALLEQKRAGELARPAYFVPESKRLDLLLRELQQQRMPMAIVVDEFGGTAGLVTIEDILEQIVGELRDEYDAQPPEVQWIGPNEAVVDGRLSLEELSAAFAVPIDDDEATTVSGLVQQQLGHIPQAGESVHIDGLRIEVLTVEGRRVRQMRVVRETSAEVSPREVEQE